MRKSASTTYRHGAALALLLLAISALYLSGINDGHRWWGDFSLYIAHAKNIASSIPYQDVKFVYSSLTPWKSPPAYPPVFPLLLAPAYAVFGLDLFVFKLVNLALMLGLLVILFYSTARSLSFPVRLAFVAAVALSPPLWSMKNLILSDMTFVFFTYVTLAIVDRAEYTDRQPVANWILFVLIGLFAYIAYGARNPGLVIIPALLTYDILKRKTIRPGMLLATLVFIACYMLQTNMLDINVDKSVANELLTAPPGEKTSEDSSPLALLPAVAERLIGYVTANVRFYALLFVKYWNNGVSITLTVVTSVIAGLLLLTGFIQTCRKRFSAGEVFCMVYICALLVIPLHQGYRYLLPVIPLLLLYIFRGAISVQQLARSRAPGFLLPATLALLISFAYADDYFPSEEDWFSVTDGSAREMFRHVREEVPDDSLILFQNARILALYTDRYSRYYRYYVKDPELTWHYIDAADASHLLLYTGKEDWGRNSLHRKIVALHNDRLEQVFENSNFRLYRIHPADTVPEPVKETHPGDTGSSRESGIRGTRLQ